MLSPVDQQIADIFKRQLEKLARPLDVRVFGSRARGDASPDSDLDIYIELEEVTPQLRDQINEAAWLVGFDRDRVISTFVVTREQLAHGALGASPIVASIMKEGFAIE